MNYLWRGVLVVGSVAALSLAAFSLPVGEARGDSDEREVRDTLIPEGASKAWQQECASCHIAFAPAFLPKASWRAMMGNLDDHFGDNASLDPATRDEILRFLEANAADSGSSKAGRRVMRSLPPGAAPRRITETRWFVNEHDEVSRATWKRESVGSPANCAACHRQAEKGQFDEHRVSIPK